MRILLVEDNAGDARLIEEMLRDVPAAVQIEFAGAASLGVALERLEAEPCDVVLLDLGLPDSQGLDTLVAARERMPDLPIVVMTGFDDEERALRALHLGAQDYLVKGRIESEPLARAIRYAVERNEITAQLNQTMHELETRTEEMESFTYSVSHDLKEPLRTLEAFSGFLLEDYGDVLDEQGRDYLERLGQASARLKDMIEKLLTLSRLGRRPPEVERVDVRQVVEGIIAVNQFTIDERHAEVVIDGDLPPVLGDLSRLEQIFGNLIGNGLKFNQSERPGVTVKLEGTVDGIVTFAVTDNGIGIAEEYHERIFGVFQRLHLREEYEGTGAGLAIVKRAANALGGSIELRSAPGEGSTFLVNLPLYELPHRLSIKRKTGVAA
ncbi:MAG TPA: ATP-binding protein [Dehalococcoidia bacterium]|nr:ATP-binding protein [Dehalococcoidia bacterium]